MGYFLIYIVNFKVNCKYILLNIFNGNKCQDTLKLRRKHNFSVVSGQAKVCLDTRSSRLVFPWCPNGFVDTRTSRFVSPWYICVQGADAFPMYPNRFADVFLACSDMMQMPLPCPDMVRTPLPCLENSFTCPEMGVYKQLNRDFQLILSPLLPFPQNLTLLFPRVYTQTLTNFLRTSPKANQTSGTCFLALDHRFYKLV